MTAADATELLRQLVETFIEGKSDEGAMWKSDVGWHRQYTESPSYLRYLGDFHHQNAVVEFMDWLLANIEPSATVWDVGCVNGYTGLVLALHGYDVAFHDYEGIGLDFIRWVEPILGDINGNGVKISITPYTTDAVLKRDWAIALDVIEHTPNALGFVRWMKELGDTVAFSFPEARFLPPYLPVLDQWTDGEALRWVIDKRYDLKTSFIADGRTYIVFE